MLSKPEPLSFSKHADLRFIPQQNFNFARTIVTAPLALEEVGEASKHYPVVFSAQAPVPLALLGLEGKNAFVAENGEWTPSVYIPAYLRAYPFALGKLDAPDSFAILFDREAPQFASNSGETLFDAAGKPSPAIERARDYLFQMQKSANQTRQVCVALETADVLNQVRAEKRSGGAVNLPSFRLCDRNKLNALPDDVILAWAKNGLLGLLTLHFNSLSNLGGL